MTEQTTGSGDLGPQPEPTTEPGEPPPGGVDAVTEGAVEGPVVPDLSPDLNPQTRGGSTPEGLRGTEDTSTEATAGRSDPEKSPDDPAKESPA